jgi:lipopolysaccharide/colanic/teichoic acid biosynthesis glycosyltransferase
MRKHKFDEIPNFINVLKGEMSIIGPRPEQQFFIDQILEKDPRYKSLQMIKPGITSWGQVKFGYASNVDEMIKRMEYDLFYLENRSIRFDLKIAFCTLGIILTGKGI